MRSERDTKGFVHISDEGVTAVVHENSGISFYTTTATATRSAMMRVNQLIADASQWPTQLLPRLDVALGQIEMIELLE